jgi:hypothetical protein
MASSSPVITPAAQKMLDDSRKSAKEAAAAPPEVAGNVLEEELVDQYTGGGMNGTDQADSPSFTQQPGWLPTDIPIAGGQWLEDNIEVIKTLPALASPRAARCAHGISRPSALGSLQPGGHSSGGAATGLGALNPGMQQLPGVGGSGSSLAGPMVASLMRPPHMLPSDHGSCGHGSGGTADPAPVGNSRRDTRPVFLRSHSSSRHVPSSTLCRDVTGDAEEALFVELLPKHTKNGKTDFGTMTSEWNERVRQSIDPERVQYASDVVIQLKNHNQLKKFDAELSKRLGARDSMDLLAKVTALRGRGPGSGSHLPGFTAPSPESGAIFVQAIVAVAAAAGAALACNHLQPSPSSGGVKRSTLEDFWPGIQPASAPAKRMKPKGKGYGGEGVQKTCLLCYAADGIEAVITKSHNSGNGTCPMQKMYTVQQFIAACIIPVYDAGTGREIKPAIKLAAAEKLVTDYMRENRFFTQQ